MQGWQTTDLGLRELGRDVTGVELRAFFSFPAERALIDAPLGDAHRLGLALHIDFPRMSGSRAGHRRGAGTRERLNRRAPIRNPWGSVCRRPERQRADTR